HQGAQRRAAGPVRRLQRRGDDQSAVTLATLAPSPGLWPPSPASGRGGSFYPRPLAGEGGTRSVTGEGRAKREAPLSSQIPRAPLQRLFPQPVAVVVEDQFFVARGRKPVVVLDFGVELARPPPGVAKGEEVFRRPLMAADIAQRLGRRRHRDEVRDR